MENIEKNREESGDNAANNKITEQLREIAELPENQPEKTSPRLQETGSKTDTEEIKQTRADVESAYEETHEKTSDDYPEDIKQLGDKMIDAEYNPGFRETVTRTWQTMKDTFSRKITKQYGDNYDSHWKYQKAKTEERILSAVGPEKFKDVISYIDAKQSERMERENPEGLTLREQGIGLGSMIKKTFTKEK